MAKTVTIPSWTMPLWECDINGITYSYPAGTVQTVPDEVAALLDAANNARPKMPEPEPDYISWHDIPDRPCGDFPTGGDTLTWDGDAEGLVNVATFYKVSDATPTAEEIGSVPMQDFAVQFSSGNYIAASFAEFASGVLFEMTQASVVIVSESGVGVDLGGGMSFPETGTYFTSINGDYTASFTITGYTGFPSVKTIDKKYLPPITWEALPDKPFYEEKAFEPIVWDGNTDGLEKIDLGSLCLVKVADEPICTDPTDIEAIALRVYATGEESEILVSEIAAEGMVQSDEHGFTIGDGFVLSSDGAYEAIGFTFGKGTWVLVQGTDRYICKINPATTVTRLDEKYMPLLTSPNGTKYKLVVADDGTLSATAV